MAMRGLSGCGVSTATNTLKALGVTGANSSLFLPANAMILDVIVLNTTANIITGGLKIGSSNGGTDIGAALAVGANAFVSLGSNLLKSVFSNSSSQQIFIDAVTLWNSANVNIYIPYFQL